MNEQNEYGSSDKDSGTSVEIQKLGELLKEENRLDKKIFSDFENGKDWINGILKSGKLEDEYLMESCEHASRLLQVRQKRYKLQAKLNTLTRRLRAMFTRGQEKVEVENLRIPEALVNVSNESTVPQTEDCSPCALRGPTVGWGAPPTATRRDRPLSILDKNRPTDVPTMNKPANAKGKVSDLVRMFNERGNSRRLAPQVDSTMLVWGSAFAFLILLCFVWRRLSAPRKAN